MSVLSLDCFSDVAFDFGLFFFGFCSCSNKFRYFKRLSFLCLAVRFREERKSVNVPKTFPLPGNSPILQNCVG